jgi:hypothetical protein
VALEHAPGARDARAVRAAIDSLDRQCIAVEAPLFQMRVTGRGQDFARWPTRLAEQLVYLAQSVGSSDDAPTASQQNVARVLHAQVVVAEQQVAQLLARNVAAFNEALRQQGVPHIVGAR